MTKVNIGNPIVTGFVHLLDPEIERIQVISGEIAKMITNEDDMMMVTHLEELELSVSNTTGVIHMKRESFKDFLEYLKYKGVLSLEEEEENTEDEEDITEEVPPIPAPVKKFPFPGAKKSESPKEVINVLPVKPLSLLEQRRLMKQKN